MSDDAANAGRRWRARAPASSTSSGSSCRCSRTVYNNIKKAIGWTLPTNGGEAMTVVVALLFGMTLPVAPIQILWRGIADRGRVGKPQNEPRRAAIHSSL
jgi:hypothetical protein